MAQNLSQAVTKMINATPQTIAKVAKRGHARIMSTNPRPNDFVRRVDGRRDAPEESVRPDGLIVITYARFAPIVEDALETLRDLSPVLSGDYRRAHTLLVGGVPAVDASGALPGETVVITNHVPYARKIEIGGMRMRVPGTDHVYEQAAAKVKRRWGKQAWVKFTYWGSGDDRTPALTLRLQ